MRRRDFIAGLGGAAWPLVARAQQPQRLRRVGVLVDTDENDPGGKAQLSGFTQGLEELGWTDGRNLRIDVRWGTANVDRMRMFAKELVDLQPDVILSQGTIVTAALQRETRSIPIVFVVVADPVGAGFAPSGCDVFLSIVIECVVAYRIPGDAALKSLKTELFYPGQGR